MTIDRIQGCFLPLARRCAKLNNSSQYQRSISHHGRDQQAPLGKTNIGITPIGLGVMQFAGGSGTFRFMYQSVSDTEMNAIIQAALDGGINWFDTAEMYGKGRSEEGLSAVVRCRSERR